MQFNDGGGFGYDTTFTFNKSADKLTLSYASSTAFSSPYASSTNLYAGSLSLGSLTGFLKATAGTVATALVDLANNVTGFLGVSNGGTGTSTPFTLGSVIFAGTGGAYNQNNSNLFWDNSNNNFGIGTSTPGQRLVVVGTVSGQHLKGIGNTPSAVVGAGAGTGASVSITGSDVAGKITLTTGTLPSASAVATTLTFASAYSSTPYVIFSAANSLTSLLSGASMVALASTDSSFTLTSGTVALTALVNYEWNYIVIE